MKAADVVILDRGSQRRTSTHFRFASKADVNPRSRMSRRANSDSTPF